MTFEHLKSIYRGYDIRGAYPSEINEETVYKIGQAIVNYFGAKTIVIGRDNRSSSLPLFENLSQGIIEQGANVIDLGLASTSMVYFASGKLDVDAAVVITASHMPSPFNGLKICKKNAVPIGIDSGLLDIKTLVQENKFSESKKNGSIVTADIKEDYHANLLTFVHLEKPFTVVVDPANMMGIVELETFRKLKETITLHTIYDTFDDQCPNHEANPLKYETLKDLSAKVLETKADLGVAFDGDADRIGFVDEQGKPVPADLIAALMAKEILQKYPGSTIVYDQRSSKSLPETIEKNGGIAIESKVGHSFVKAKMRETMASLGAELAGHYFFRDNYYAESGSLPALLILELMQKTNKPLSELVKEVKRYHHSGEINSTVTQTPEEIYNELEKKYPDGNVDKLDGIKIVYNDWWFNARPSANDPVMRLTLEANTQELMNEKVQEVLAIIRK